MKETIFSVRQFAPRPLKGGLMCLALVSANAWAQSAFLPDEQAARMERARAYAMTVTPMARAASQDKVLRTAPGSGKNCSMTVVDTAADSKKSYRGLQNSETTVVLSASPILVCSN